MSKLSPAAQAVLDAFRAVPDLRDCPSIAGALRAVADQVVPEPGDYLPEQNCRWYRLGVSAYRHKLLAIAAELEGAK